MIRSPLFWTRSLFAALFLIVTFLTLTPNPEDTQSGFALARWIARLLFGDTALTDKVAHFLAYGALGATAFWARLDLLQKLWATPLALAVYGAALEGVQGIGGVRSPELADAAANALGAVAGFAGALLLAKIVKARAA